MAQGGIVPVQPPVNQQPVNSQVGNMYNNEPKNSPVAIVIMFVMLIAFLVSLFLYLGEKKNNQKLSGGTGKTPTNVGTNNRKETISVKGYNIPVPMGYRYIFQSGNHGFISEDQNSIVFVNIDTESNTNKFNINNMIKTNFELVKKSLVEEGVPEANVLLKNEGDRNYIQFSDGIGVYFYSATRDEMSIINTGFESKTGPLTKGDFNKIKPIIFETNKGTPSYSMNAKPKFYFKNVTEALLK